MKRKPVQALGLQASLFAVVLTITATGHDHLMAQAKLHMKNGAILFGEVKKMEFAKLTLDTDDYDLIEIDWEPIKSMTAPGPFNIILADGRTFAGAIEMDSVSFTILSTVPVVVPRTQVGSFDDFSVGFWNAVTASVDLGVNLVRGNNYVTTISSTTNLRWESVSTQLFVSGSSIVNDQQEGSDTRRFTAQGGVAQHVIGQIRLGVVGSYEHDENQQLEARVLATGFTAFRPISYQRTRLDILLGAGPTYEKYLNQDGETIREGRAGLTFVTKPNNDTDLSLDCYLYPTIFDFDRVRVESDLDFRIKVIEDFTFNISVYYRFNNKPPEGVGENDYGLTLGLGWSN